MKIVTPLSTIENYEPLVKAGAGEFYCGFIPIEWLEKYTTCYLNRRELLFNSSNICTRSSLKILRKMIDVYKVPVKFTFNSLFYTPEKYELLIKILKELIDFGFDTFIIADPALMLYIKQANLQCHIHLSGEVCATNRYSIEFFQQFPVNRYVFPRKTAIADMRTSIQNSGLPKSVSYEAFILNSLCLYSGAFCNSLHSQGVSWVCSFPAKTSRSLHFSDKTKSRERQLQIVDKMENKTINKVLKTYESGISKYSVGNSGCGLCRINELKQAGVEYFKVVGRSRTVQTLRQDVIQLKRIIDGITEKDPDFTSSELIREKVFDNKCPGHCYYP